MTNKSITIVISSAPYSSSSFREGLDLVLAACTFDRDVNLLLRDNAVYALLPGQETTHIDQKNLSQIMKALPIYGLPDIHVCKTSLDARGIKNAPDLPAKVISEQEVNELIINSHNVIRF